jgi:hypothetical protein
MVALVIAIAESTVARIYRAMSIPTVVGDGKLRAMSVCTQLVGRQSVERRPAIGDGSSPPDRADPDWAGPPIGRPSRPRDPEAELSTWRSGRQ